MGRVDIEVPHVPYMYGGAQEQLCRECRLPCALEVTSVDCVRRFFLQGMLHCTYLVYGYCFLNEVNGCVLDNGGEHEAYWMKLLNEYFHNVMNREETEPDFVRRSEELKKLVFDQIDDRQVPLCRYFEEYYHRIMEDGGGMSEAMMEKLDEAYLSLLAGTSRKR